MKKSNIFLFFSMAISVPSAFGFKIDPVETYHQDHRASYAKLKYIAPSQRKIGVLSKNTVAKDVNKTILAFLRSQSQAFGITDEVDLKLTDVKESLLGKHYHFQQIYSGYPVHHGNIVVSVKLNSGKIYKVYNNLYPVKQNSVVTVNTLNKGVSAYDIAWDHLRVHGALIEDPNSRMVYLPQGENFRLAYITELAVEAPFGYWEHTIDAQTGEILSVRDTSLPRRPKQKQEVNFSDYSGEVLDRSLAFKSRDAKVGKIAAAKSRSLSALASGTALVFDPDPRTTLMRENMEDTEAAATFDAAYFTRPLFGLTQSGNVFRLDGPWAKIINFEVPNTAPSTTADGNWTAKRGDNAFNDVMTYFHIDQNQRYIQSLGFKDATGIQFAPIEIDSNGLGGGDNSHFLPSSNRLSFGHGCVDDNEDAFVILHEYGHAINFSINSNWFGGDTGAMGEGFGDYWAGSYRISTPNGSTFHPEWAFPWDGNNDCWNGRSLDKTSAEYDHSQQYVAHQPLGGFVSDELWSTPLFQSLVTLMDQGVPREDVDTIVLQAQFGLGSGLKMRDMANSIVNTAQSLFPNGPHKDVFLQKFQSQSILTDVGSNVAPTAAFKFSTNNLVVNFSDQSNDSDGNVVGHSWNFGDGATSSQGSPSHTYSSAGSFSVRLTVTDNDGATNSTTETVIVTEPDDGQLQNNVPITALSDATGLQKRFTMQVPAGATALRFSMSGGNGDADLYVRFALAPTTQTYDCRPFENGNEETCNISNVRAGTYHVMVQAYRTYSEVDLVGSYSSN